MPLDLVKIYLFSTDRVYDSELKISAFVFSDGNTLFKLSLPLKR